MLQYTPDCTALSLTVERWLAVTLHMSLSGHAVERWLAVITRNSWVEIFQLERICRATDPRERARLCTAKVWRDKSKRIKNYGLIRVYTFTSYGILLPRCVWCEPTGEVSRQTAKIDIFIQKIVLLLPIKSMFVTLDNDMDTSSSLHVEGHIR